MIRFTLRTLIVAIVAASPCSLAVADVTLPKIFGDHMVLQQDVKLPVWGWAEPGERVTVSFAGQTAEIVTGPDKRWRVELKPVQSTDAGRELIVKGANTVTIKDV